MKNYFLGKLVSTYQTHPICLNFWIKKQGEMPTIYFVLMEQKKKEEINLISAT